MNDVKKKITPFVKHIVNRKSDSALADRIVEYIRGRPTPKKLHFLQSFEANIKDYEIDQKTIKPDDPAIKEYKSPPRPWAIYRMEYPETRSFVKQAIERLSDVKRSTRVKEISLEHAKALQEKHPWDNLKEAAQNRINSFLGGKRKKNKPFYRFLLSCFELNRKIVKNTESPAVATIEIAKGKEAFKEFKKPGPDVQRDLIDDYRIKYRK